MIDKETRRIGIKERGDERRERNEINGDCINENLSGTHGKRTHGVRCYRCHLVKKHGAAWVREHGLVEQIKQKNPQFEAKL